MENAQCLRPRRLPGEEWWLLEAMARRCKMEVRGGVLES